MASVTLNSPFGRPVPAGRRFHCGASGGCVSVRPKKAGSVAPRRAIGDAMQAVLVVVDIALRLYMWVIIASAIFSWLYAFGVVNPRNDAVAAIGRTLYQLTEPALRPIRRFVPVFGGLDISPVILILIIILIRQIIWRYIYPNVF
jgi:YggT family protein